MYHSQLLSFRECPAMHLSSVKSSRRSSDLVCLNAGEHCLYFLDSSCSYLSLKIWDKRLLSGSLLSSANLTLPKTPPSAVPVSRSNVFSAHISLRIWTLCRKKHLFLFVQRLGMENFRGGGVGVHTFRTLLYRLLRYHVRVKMANAEVIAVLAHIRMRWQLQELFRSNDTSMAPTS